MSEQNPVDSSEYQVENGERQEASTSPNFIDYADVILDQVDEAEPSETFTGIQAIITSVEATANEGLITSSRGEVQTADHIHSALDMYIDWAKQDVNERTPKSPLLLLTRKGGLRSAFSELASDERTESTLLAVLEQNKAERLKTADVAVPTGDSLQDLMGASEARQIMGVEAAPQSELPPAEREEIEDELADEAFEQVGILEPEAAQPDSLKFDLEAAKARLEKQDAERAIPKNDLYDLGSNVNDLLHQLDVVSRHSGGEARAARENITSGVLIDRLVGKIRQEREGVRTFSKQTLAYEFGTYLTMAGNPNVVNHLMDEARNAELFDEQELMQMESVIAALSRTASAEGDGPQYNSVVSQLQSFAERHSETPKTGALDFAVHGAIIGAYTHLGDSDALHYASRIHNSNIASYENIKK